MAQYQLTLHYAGAKSSAGESQRLCADVPAPDATMEDGGALPPESATVVRPAGEL